MDHLTIRGTPDELTAALRRVGYTTERKNLEGWPMFHPDEEWFYMSAGDSSVCPDCMGFESQVLGGDEIPMHFPYYEVLDMITVHPHLHMALGRASPCRCRLHLQNPAKAVENRLHEELVLVI